MDTAALTHRRLESALYFALARTSALQLPQAGLNLAYRHCTSVYKAYNAARTHKRVALMFREVRGSDVADLIPQAQLLYNNVNDLLRTAKENGIARWPLLKRYLAQLEDSNDSMGDLLESFHLSQDKDFRELVDKAIHGLNKSKDPPDWRSSLASLQD